MRRIFYQRGSTIIESELFHTNKTNQLKLYETGSKISVKTILREGYPELDKKETFQIKEKIKSRVEKNSTIWYQLDRGNKYNLPNYIFKDINKNSRERLIVVLFLHSVDDSQYEFGLDGFLDIVEWTYNTIEVLIKNKNVYKILVKPHTSIDYKNYNCEKIFIGKLKNKFAKCKKVKFINQKIMNKEFKKIKNIFGISHHGSVIEELCYLNIPCICSSKTPWQNYPFLKMWNSVDEYNDILIKLSSTNSKSYLSNKDLLFKYSYYYRNYSVDREFWCRLYKQYYGIFPKNYYIELPKFEKKMENMSYKEESLKILFETDI